MSVFISYSHKDLPVVDRITRELVDANVPVWLDRWELSPGDSLVAKIQDGIEQADCLCVVLSEAAVSSEWCAKEMNAGIIRELDEKRVVVVPVLVEDCKIPTFLREKMYADFRTDFGAGMKSLIEALSGAINDAVGRVDKPDYVTDYAFDWGEFEDAFVLQVECVSFARDQAYSIYSHFRIIGNEVATRRYRLYESKGLGWVFRRIPIEMVAEVRNDKNAKLTLDPGHPEGTFIGFVDKKSGMTFELHVRSRRLGDDNGKTALFPFGQVFGYIAETLQKNERKLRPNETALMKEILQTPVA